MKRRTLIVSLVLAAALLGFAAAAGGGSDPLVSLSYLNTDFTAAAEQQIQSRLDAAGLPRNPEVPDAVSSMGWTELCLKQGDRLRGAPGTQWLALSGGVSLSSGVAVDATDGVELSAGSVMTPRHRCLLDGDGVLTVDSKTAVVSCCGSWALERSAGPDYYAIAAALRDLNLFVGTDTGYGQGFDLDAAPTRIQALIMLIRLLGEERAARDSTAVNPFPDVPAWAERYTAYAFERGYTNGVENGLFAPDRTANAGMYTEFVLRALGYSSTAQADVRTAPDRGLEAGVLTAGERDALQSGEFLRADVAYLSWYALEAVLPEGGWTLHDKLEGAGVFASQDYLRASGTVLSPRL